MSRREKKKQRWMRSMAGSALNSGYVVVPRGYKQQSFLPDGSQDGKEWIGQYGYVGLTVERLEFVMDGINEAGLAAGLFYFPGYGKYETYDNSRKKQSVSDFQLVAWILSNFSRIEDVKTAMQSIHVTSIDPRSSTVHWRITEENGKQVVVEIVDGEVHFYDNTTGVLTNSPGFEWHLTNLNNYTNLTAGAVSSRQIGDMTLTAFGGGGGLHGIPGDMTPPSRFVRAAFFQSTAPIMSNSIQTVEQAFHILNNFDIPIGIQFSTKEDIPDIPSATQWTVATDLTHRCIYYRTMYNSLIRCIDMKDIDFKKVRFHSAALDKAKQQPIEQIIITK